jgi:hypothetical protein
VGGLFAVRSSDKNCMQNFYWKTTKRREILRFSSRDYADPCLPGYEAVLFGALHTHTHTHIVSTLDYIAHMSLKAKTKGNLFGN